MNPLTNVKNVTKLSELALSSKDHLRTWHSEYKDSAWIFVGGLPYDLSEGDIMAVFSQCGEIVDINLVRDKVSGKHKGFCFICYEDQRSTILTVDNLNGIKILGRTIRVDHVKDYKPPKEKPNDKSDNLEAKDNWFEVKKESVVKKERISHDRELERNGKRKHGEDNSRLEIPRKKPTVELVPKHKKHVTKTDSSSIGDMGRNKTTKSKKKKKRKIETSSSSESQSEEDSSSTSDESSSTTTTTTSTSSSSDSDNKRKSKHAGKKSKNYSVHSSKSIRKKAKKQHKNKKKSKR